MPSLTTRPLLRTGHMLTALWQALREQGLVHADAPVPTAALA